VINEKYPGGAVGQARLLEQDGHTIVFDKNGKPKKVRDYEKALLDA
jgi:hypothetical protein